jgi:tRNA pseudouridine38-40 synthase
MSYGHAISDHRRGTPSLPLQRPSLTLPPQLYGPRNVTVPKMPALGLLLEHPLFDNYNRKVDGLNAALPGPDAPEWRAPLDFEAHRAAIDAFKQAFIYGSMRAIEDKTGLFDAWVRHLDKYTGDDLNWVGPHTVLLPRRSV